MQRMSVWIGAIGKGTLAGSGGRCSHWRDRTCTVIVKGWREGLE